MFQDKKLVHTVYWK